MTTNAVELDQKFTNRDPATGEVVSEHRIASAEDVKAAVNRARVAQASWNALGTARRIAVLRKFQELLLGQRDALAAKFSAESGKPLVESMLSEIVVALDAARFC